MAVLAAAKRNDPEAALFSALDKSVQAVTSFARRSGSQQRDFASTLLLCIVTGDEVSCLQLGDGAIVASTGDAVQRLTRAWQSPYAGETVFLTSPGARDLATVTRRSAADLTGVALLSDGLEPVATDLTSGEPFAPFFLPLFRFTGQSEPDLHNRELEALLASERVRSRTHDDTTLLIAARELH